MKKGTTGLAILEVHTSFRPAVPPLATRGHFSVYNSLDAELNRTTEGILIIRTEADAEAATVLLESL